MTLPSELFPESAWNFSSVAALAARSKGDHEASWIATAGTAVTSFVSNWLDGFDDLIAAGGLEVGTGELLRDLFVGIVGALLPPGLAELITGIGGDAVEDLTLFFQRLREFLGSIDLLAGDFDLRTAVVQFIEISLDIARQVLTLGLLQRSQTNGGFPYGFPIEFPDGTPLKRVLRNLSRVMDQDFSEVGFGLDDELSAAVQRVLNRFDIQNIIDNVLNAADNFGEIRSTTNPVATVVTSVLSIVASALNANKGLSAAEQRIAALEAEILAGPASTFIADDFNRPAASTVSAAGDPWTVAFTSGGGAGSIGLDGEGNAYWVESGSSARTQILRFDDDSLDDDNFVVTFFIADAGEFGVVSGDPYLYVSARMHASSETYVRLRIHNGGIPGNNAQLQAVNAGVVTDIGSPGDVFTTSGVRFDWYGGNVSEPRAFTLKRNGATVWDIEDTGDVSQVGASYRHVGFGMTAQGPAIGSQAVPPRLAVFSAQET